jgi:hypothetical protein
VITAYEPRPSSGTGSRLSSPLASRRSTSVAVVVALAFNGAGEWSVDNAIGWDVAGVAWGLGAPAAALLGAGSVLALRAHARSTAMPSEPAAEAS